MIAVENLFFSDDIAEKHFVCDLSKCKGACCVEGESGAPLSEDELEILDQEYANFAPYIGEAGKKAVAEQGKYIYDKEDEEYKTPLLEKHGACAYITYSANGTAMCGIEQAYLDGKTTFRKPISCHLYPIRITEYDDFHAINYETWDICNPACKLGDELKIPIYKFCKDGLVRKYGEEMYDNLVATIEQQFEGKIDV